MVGKRDNDMYEGRRKKRSRDPLMGRRDFMRAGIAAGGLAAAGRFTAPGRLWGNEDDFQRPNVLFILVDDLGYHDLGVQGAEDIKTPHIDRLAMEGVRCTDGYCTAPQCGPSRAGLLTGRYQNRFGFENNVRPRPAHDHYGLPVRLNTMADHMKAARYRTGIIGKWHLGRAEEFHPLNRGFDEFTGFLGGARSYFPDTDGHFHLDRNGEEARVPGEYLTDVLTDAALDFIGRDSRDPFFLYLSHLAPHTPMEATDRYLERFPEIKDERRRTYAAMMASLDDGVGRICDRLEELGIAENTLIFFASDNGGPTQQNTSRNDPFSGYKGDLLEGGIRVPYIVRWKGTLPAGRVYNNPVSTLDVLPTSLGAAGGSLPEGEIFDGVNLLPYLTGAADSVPADRMFWRFGPMLAMREGDFKLLQLLPGHQELHNIAQNKKELKEFQITDDEASLKRMGEALSRWNAELADPGWDGFPVYHVRLAAERYGLSIDREDAQQIYDDFFGL